MKKTAIESKRRNKTKQKQDIVMSVKNARRELRPQHFSSSMLRAIWMKDRTGIVSYVIRG